MSTITPQADSVEAKRFAFGKNWRGFLSVLDEERIREAMYSLKETLRVETLEGDIYLHGWR